MFEAGLISLFIDLKVSIAEMREWEPSRIKALFTGIALAHGAANGSILAGVCEHGVIDGDWCEPCNKEAKAARTHQ